MVQNLYIAHTLVGPILLASVQLQVSLLCYYFSANDIATPTPASRDAAATPTSASISAAATITCTRTCLLASRSTSMNQDHGNSMAMMHEPRPTDASELRVISIPKWLGLGFGEGLGLVGF